MVSEEVFLAVSGGLALFNLSVLTILINNFRVFNGRMRVIEQNVTRNAVKNGEQDSKHGKLISEIAKVQIALENKIELNRKQSDAIVKSFIEDSKSNQKTTHELQITLARLDETLKNMNGTFANINGKLAEHEKKLYDLMLKKRR